MNRVVKIVFMISVFSSLLFAQTQWQTTQPTGAYGNCQLESNTIKITVHPFHVDVEEEAVIATRGNVNWGDPASLEIEGHFTLTQGSAIRSMLLWNGNKILKAKLKDRAFADSAYESVVDRNVWQPVRRDPCIIRYLGNSTYDFKIFPVAINASRKIRILYSVPYQMTSSGPQFQISPAFTSGADQKPTQIPVEIQKGNLSQKTYLLGYGGVTKTLQFGATYQIPIERLFANAYYDYNSNEYINSATNPITIMPDTAVTTTAFSTSIASGKLAGNYTAIFATPPDTVYAVTNELADQSIGINVEAKVVVGEKSYITDFNFNGYLGVYIKSTAQWDSLVYWTVYNSSGKKVLQCVNKYNPSSDSIVKTMLPLIWGAKYSLVEGTDNIGSLLGFVDMRMSLLALEADTLSAVEAAKWVKSGVPILKPEEIKINPKDISMAPDENVIFEYGNTGTLASKKGLSKNLIIELLANKTVSLKFATTQSGIVKAVLYDISGRILQTWNSISLSGNCAKLQLPLTAKGCVIMRVFAGKEVMQKKLTIMK